MKSFLISGIFLAVFVAATGINCYFVTDILGETYESLSELSLLPDDADDSAFLSDSTMILDYWNSKKSFLSLTVNDAELRDCTISLENLRQRSVSSDSADRKAALYEARTRICALFIRERFSLANIL